MADSLDRLVTAAAAGGEPVVPPLSAAEAGANVQLYALMGGSARGGDNKRAVAAAQPKQGRKKDKTAKKNGETPKSPKPEVTCRVLMLHGWTQNEEVFQRRTGPLRRRAEKAGVELVFVSAPHPLPDGMVPPEDDGEVREDARSWFSVNRENPVDTRGVFENTPRPYHGIDASVDVIRGLWEREGGFHGLCGFSQGAVVAHHIVREAEAAKKVGRTPAIAPSFVVLACGYPARCPSDWDQLQETGYKLGTPSLHIHGDDDPSVPMEVQDELESFFHQPETLVHEKGHALPQRAAELEQVVNFMLQHKDKHPRPVKGTPAAAAAGGGGKGGGQQETRPKESAPSQQETRPKESTPSGSAAAPAPREARPPPAQSSDGGKKKEGEGESKGESKCAVQ